MGCTAHGWGAHSSTPPDAGRSVRELLGFLPGQLAGQHLLRCEPGRGRTRADGATAVGQRAPVIPADEAAREAVEVEINANGPGRHSVAVPVQWPIGGTWADGAGTARAEPTRAGRRRCGAVQPNSLVQRRLVQGGENR